MLLSPGCSPVPTSGAAVDGQGSREAEPLRAAGHRGCGGCQGQVLRVPGEAEPLHRGRNHRNPEGVSATSRGTRSPEPPLRSLRAPGHPAQGAATGRVGSAASFAPSPRAAPGAAGCREPRELPRGSVQHPRPGWGPGQPRWSRGSRGQGESSICRHGGSGRRGGAAGRGPQRDWEGWPRAGGVTKGLGGDCEWTGRGW